MNHQSLTKRPIQTVLPLEQYHRAAAYIGAGGDDNAGDSSSNTAGEKKKETTEATQTSLSWGWYLAIVLIGLAILGLLIYMVVALTANGTLSTTTPTTDTPTVVAPMSIRAPGTLGASPPPLLKVKSITGSEPQLQGGPWSLLSDKAPEWIISQWDGGSHYKVDMKSSPSSPRTYTVTLASLSVSQTITVQLLLFSEKLKYEVIASSGPISVTSELGFNVLLVANSDWSDLLVASTYDHMSRILFTAPMLKVVVMFESATASKKEWNILASSASALMNIVRPPPFPVQDLVVVTSQSVSDGGCANVQGECIVNTDCKANTTIVTTKTLNRVAGSSTLIDLSQVSPVTSSQIVTCLSMPTAVILGSPATSLARRNGVTLLMNKEIYQYLSTQLDSSQKVLGSLDQTLEDMLTPPVQLAASTLQEVKTIFSGTFVYNDLTKAVFNALVSKKPSTNYLQIAQCILSSKLDLHADSPNLPALEVLQADLCMNPDCFSLVNECQAWLEQHGIAGYMRDLLAYL